MSRLYNDKVVRTIDRVKPTLGLEKTKEYKKKLQNKKKPTGSGTKNYYVPKNFNKGGRVGLKGGSGFPDLNKDGETTFADVLIGRGVIPKNKKNKKKMIAKKSKTPMDKAVKKDKKNKRFV